MVCHCCPGAIPTRSSRQPWGTKSPKRMCVTLAAAPPAASRCVALLSPCEDGPSTPRDGPCPGSLRRVFVSVIGCGYLGAVHAACMADLGHHVVGVDVEEAKVKELSAGRPPFFEPGLPELLERAMASGRLRFDSDISTLARESGEPWVHFVCVGTPQRTGEFAADTTYVEAAVTALLPYL